MPSEAEHLAFANRTQLTIAHLLSDMATHSPWLAITAFYKAVHVVEAVFAFDRSVGHTSSHEEREQALKRARKYEKIYRHYAPLKRASLNARYLSETGSFDNYLPPPLVVNQLLRHHLHQVEESACKHFLKNAAALQRILAVAPDPI